MNKDFVINVLKYLPINIFFKKLYAGEGSILFMHKVVVKHDNKDRINLMKANEIEVFYLEKMLVYLKKKYDLISLDQINERLKNKSKFKKKFIVITFDDGYKDNLTLAYPMFKKHNIPFTIYITNCYPNHTGKLWWYMLEDILLENDYVEFFYQEKLLGFDTKNKKQKNISFIKIRELIINATEKEQDLIFNYLEKKYNKTLKDYVKKESLTWEEIKKISKDSLVTIGCHTKNHLALNTLSEEEQIEEILTSKTEIEAKIDKVSNHFAYPFGTSNEINEKEVNNLKQTKVFKTATTTRMGNIFNKHINHLHTLPRIQVLGTQQDLSILNLYLCGAIPAIKNRFKRIVTL